jgi:hypothetical protein
MNSVHRFALWVAVASLLIAAIPGTGNAAQGGSETSAARIVALSVKASFNHGGKQPKYFSFWSGELPCQCILSNNESMEIYFPVDVGENPSSLSARWTVAPKAKRPISTGPVYISLVKHDIEPTDVLAWTQLKKSDDPSLAISLIASPGKDGYTNKDEVEGRIVAWLSSRKEVLCLPLAELRIPPHSIQLKYASDQQGEPSVELTVRAMRITDTEEDTWALILQRGNKHLKLPSDPDDAESQSFSARSSAAGEEGLLGTTAISRVFLQSYRAREIGVNDMKKMVGLLDASVASQKSADLAQATRNMMRSSKGLDDLVKKGEVTPEASRLVFKLSEKVLAHGSSGARAFAGRFVPPPSAPSGPEVTYVVRQTSGGYTPDGTSTYPFWSISQAYDAARAVDSRLVELSVDGGYYEEPVNIDRNTVLRAVTGTRPIIASTLMCTRAVQLEITGFSLLGAPSPGALQVLVPGSSVSLTDVEIREATRYGIFQRGGEIQLRSVTIRDTRRERGQMEYGAALVLQDGIQAFLSSVTLNDNESSAIILSGRDSYMSGTDVVLRRNKVHPEFYSEVALNPETPSGALLVTDQVRANLTNLQMHRNEFIGLGVYGDAEMTVNSAVIDSGRSIRTADAEGVMRNYGGMGIRARDGGHITMQNFTISDCDLVGVAVHPRGEIDLHIGDVCRNLVGVYLAEGYAIDRLTDRVLYYDNGRNLDAEVLPVPGSGL